MKTTNIQILIPEDTLDELMRVSCAESIDEAIRLAVEHCLECEASLGGVEEFNHKTLH